MTNPELPPYHAAEPKTLEKLTSDQIEGLLGYLTTLYERQVEVQAAIDPFAHDAIRRAAIDNRLPTPNEYTAVIESAKSEGAFKALQEVAGELDAILGNSANTKTAQD